MDNSFHSSFNSGHFNKHTYQTIDSFFIAAALSEYDEFPLGTEPNALSLLAFGTIVGGISFALAIKMSFQGAYKLYTD